MVSLRKVWEGNLDLPYEAKQSRPIDALMSRKKNDIRGLQEKEDKEKRKEGTETKSGEKEGYRRLVVGTAGT